METIAQSHHDSLLGRLLVKEKLISEHHIADALTLQRNTGQRLGEIFAEWKLITHDQLQAALHTQHHVRLIPVLEKALVASLEAAALIAPLEAYAAPPLPEPVTMSAPQITPRALSDKELSEISGQSIQKENLNAWLNMKSTQSGSNTALQNIVNDLLHPKSTQNAGLQVLGDLTKLMNPLLMLLSADTTVSDIVYDPAHAAAVVNADGSITLNLPSSIGQISFQNIRVAGNTTGPSLGSIILNKIDLTGTTITLKPH
ncbi:MAG: hypothetical protein ACHP7O_11530 [Burkholderiales bacterium]